MLGSVEVFDVSATTKDEFRSSPVPFLGFLALVVVRVGLPGVRRTRFRVFSSLSVWAPALWGVLLIKRLPEVAFNSLIKMPSEGGVLTLRIFKIEASL